MASSNQTKNRILNQNNNSWVIVTDFDGTITEKDTIKFLLNNYASPNWRNTQKLIDNGSLNEIEGLSKLLSYLTIDWKIALKKIEDNISIDKGFDELIQFINHKNIPIIIVSSGLEEIIKTVLNDKINIFKSVFANRLLDNHKKLTVFNPNSKISLNHNNTKEAVICLLKKEGKKVIYLGDGFSDVFAAKKSDIVFAKEDLKIFFKKNKLDCHNLESLKDVADYLKINFNEN